MAEWHIIIETTELEIDIEGKTTPPTVVTEAQNELALFSYNDPASHEVEVKSWTAGEEPEKWRIVLSGEGADPPHSLHTEAERITKAHPGWGITIAKDPQRPPEGRQD